MRSLRRDGSETCVCGTLPRSGEVSTRFHVPLTSLHSLSHLIVDSSANMRSFRTCLCSGVWQHLGLGLGNVGIDRLTDYSTSNLSLVLTRLSRLDFAPCLAVFAIMYFLVVLHISLTFLFFQYSSADFSNSLSAKPA